MICVPWGKSEESRMGLQKEHVLSNHCVEQGLPLATIHLLHLATSVDFIVQEYIKGEVP